jgi:hypothetical protein
MGLGRNGFKADEAIAKFVSSFLDILLFLTKESVFLPCSAFFLDLIQEKKLCVRQSQPYHIFTFFSSSELPTTERELKAMAAAAMMGLSRPKAAIGFIFI